MFFEKYIQLQDIKLCMPSIEMAKDLCRLVCHNQSEFKYIGYTRTLTDIPKCEDALKLMIERFKNGSLYGYMIFKGCTLIGYVGIKVRPPGHVAEISYYLDKCSTGNGYICKAVTALEDVFFSQGGHRCEIFCNETNTKSCRTAKRLGYQLDGIMREYEFMDGSYQGVAIYSKINLKTL